MFYYLKDQFGGGQVNLRFFFSFEKGVGVVTSTRGSWFLRHRHPGDDHSADFFLYCTKAKPLVKSYWQPSLSADLLGKASFRPYKIRVIDRVPH